MLSLCLVIGLGVFLLYDDVYFWITGTRLHPEQVAGENKLSIPRISTDELKNKLDRDDNFLLIDVRTPDEYATGHIAKSVNIPLADIDNQIGKIALAKDKEIVTMCDNVGCNRSDQATTKLIGLGFENVRSYSDGIYAWEYAGYPTTTETLDKNAFIEAFRNFQTNEISVDDAHKKIFSENAVVIDVQERANYGLQHLENAIYLDLANVSPRAADGSIPKNRPVIIYSEDGLRSKIAVAAFIKQGYKDIWSMTGGIAAWQSKKYEVTRN